MEMQRDTLADFASLVTYARSETAAPEAQSLLAVARQVRSIRASQIRRSFVGLPGGKT